MQFCGFDSMNARPQDNIIKASGDQPSLKLWLAKQAKGKDLMN